MTSRRILKLVHLYSTSWFAVCAAYLLVLALRQAGATWWLIFSLSGYSAVLGFLLTSIYLFAIFRGVGRSQTIEIEYPLTSSEAYMLFYDCTPFLGTIAGFLGTLGIGSTLSLVNSVATGTMAATVLVWIIIDPAIAVVEMSLPVGRRHRKQRLAQAKAVREKQRLDSERLLAEIFQKEQLQRQQWQQLLEPMAGELGDCIKDNKLSRVDTEQRVVEIGARAWRIGGISFMRQLSEMAGANSEEEFQDCRIRDYVSVWWDGIGTWKRQAFIETLRKSA